MGQSGLINHAPIIGLPGKATLAGGIGRGLQPQGGKGWRQKKRASWSSPIIQPSYHCGRRL